MFLQTHRKEGSSTNETKTLFCGSNPVCVHWLNTADDSFFEAYERNKIIVLLVHGFSQIPKRGLQVTVDFRNFFECFGVHDTESGQLFVGSCKLILKKLHFVRSFQ